MPLYEYTCVECKKNFEVIRTSNERDDEIECPYCKVIRKMSRQASLTQAAKSQEQASTSLSGGGSCGAPTGFK